MDITPEMTKALDKAKVQVMLKKDGVFLSTVMLNLRHVWDDTIPTACTNGRHIKYNPTFFMAQSEPVRCAIIAHETWHVILYHMTRGKLKDAERYNRAGDYVINLLVQAAKFTLGQGWLIEHQYAGMSTEQVYDLLPQNSGAPNPMAGDIQPPDPTDKALPADLDEIIVRAAMQSRGRDRPGTIPGEVAVYLDTLLNPVVPWYKHLSPFLTKLVRSGYNYHRPNRRFLPKYFLPSSLSSSLCSIAVAADISGSTYDGFPQFIGETAAILNNYRPETLTFLTFDTKIQTNEVLHSLADLKAIEFKGLGGTDVDPIMEWADINKPNVLIVFTDGYYDPPTIHPKCPVVWVVYNNEHYVAPFGKLIHFTVE